MSPGRLPETTMDGPVTPGFIPRTRSQNADSIEGAGIA
jgi:hypothetical protein